MGVILSARFDRVESHRVKASAAGRDYNSMRARSIDRRYWIKLSIPLALATLVLSDWARRPDRQFSVAMYDRVILSLYRTVVRPVTHHFTKCRFTPSCSSYSQEAVRLYGFPKGVCLTARRLLQCWPWVPLGTRDPVAPSVSGPMRYQKELFTTAENRERGGRGQRTHVAFSLGNKSTTKGKTEIQ